MKGIKIFLLLFCLAASFFLLLTEIGLSFASFALAAALLMVASALHLSVHELGHLAGGWISGYQLVSLQIGPVHLEANRAKKLSFSLKYTWGGQCIMLPPKETAGPFRAYNLGGIAANLLISAASPLLLFLHSAWTVLFFWQLLFLGLIKIWMNLFPRLNRGIPNDGYVVRLLKRGSAVQKDYAVYLSLYASMVWQEPIYPEKYLYARAPAKGENDLLYYHEIQSLLEKCRTPYAAHAEKSRPPSAVLLSSKRA